MEPWHPLSPRWTGLRPGRALVLPLPDAAFSALPAHYVVEGLTLARKREFHLTLLSTATTRALAAALAALPRAAAAGWRRDAFAAADWRWRLTGERWLVGRRGGGKPAAHSVIACVEQPAQAAFRAAVAALLGTALPAPFPHVTLFTHGDRGGIGLPDRATFEARRIRRLTGSL
jgi:hypothetical protein